MIAMKYNGKGFHIAVPAHDLSAEEVAYYGREFLLSTGLYEEVKEKPVKKAENEEV